jgi:DNA (cytosine-5)-methyltransferase 1
VFVVASARTDFDPASVLFEFDGVRRDTAPSREKGQRIAPTVTNGPPFSRTGNDRVETDAVITMAHGQGGAEIATDRSPTLTCNHEAPIAAYSLPITFSGQMSNPHTDVDIMQTLQAKNPMAVATAMQVRRLTPVECERLQGFPDNYTDIKLKGKPTPDGPRYKALGNSWAVPVVRWIGSRIAQEVQRLESTSPKENP